MFNDTFTTDIIPHFNEYLPNPFHALVSLSKPEITYGVIFTFILDESVEIVKDWLSTVKNYLSSSNLNIIVIILAFSGIGIYKISEQYEMNENRFIIRFRVLANWLINSTAYITSISILLTIIRMIFFGLSHYKIQNLKKDIIKIIIEISLFGWLILLHLVVTDPIKNQYYHELNIKYGYNHDLRRRKNEKGQDISYCERVIIAFKEEKRSLDEQRARKTRNHT